MLDSKPNVPHLGQDFFLLVGKVFVRRRKN